MTWVSMIHFFHFFVFCISAGVGRTGTYLALDIVMDHAQHEKEVNIYAIVKRMREERCCMVQNKVHTQLQN